MAPIQAPLTPEQADAYVPLKTPEERHRLPEKTPTSTTRVVAGRIAQLLVVLCMAFYIFGQVLVLTPLYSDKLAKTIQVWWGVPKNQPKGGAKGHAEMVRPTYFILFAVLPLLAIVLLVDFLRTHNVRRISSQYVLQLALVLRRKPVVFGKVSYWSYGEWLFLAAVVLGNVFVFVRYLVSRIKAKKPKDFNAHLECIGLTFGFTCLFNMAFLLLPATRGSAWMEFFNISYANSIKYHRWLGVATLFTGLLHLIAYYTVWLREGHWIKEAMPCFGEKCDISKKPSSKRWQNFFGELAFLLFVIMAAASVPCVRRKFYNVFYYTHQLLFAALALLSLHWINAIWWYLPALVLYCGSRAVSWVNGASPVDVLEVTALSPNLVKVVFRRSPGREGSYKVGQFLYLNVPAISRLQWHAFTVASSPRTNATTVTVLLKSLGDWTDDLVKHAIECKEKNVLPTVYVDGFYGASLEMYDEYATVCLVAGGIGVTPILSILNDMITRLSSSSLESLPRQKVVFLFAFRELALLEEIAPVLMQLRELDPQQQHVRFHLTLTNPVTDDALDTKLSPRTAPKAAEPSVATRRSFTQPLLSAPFKSVAMMVAFAVSVVSVSVIAYGTKIKRNNAKLWPFEQFVEISVAMAGAIVAVVAVVLVERVLVTNGNCKSHVVQDLSTPFTAQSLQIETYRELFAELNVMIGEQPNVAALLRETHATHSVVGGFQQTTIGVFASGPETLKRAVEKGIAQIDSSAFDLREEQFEL
jgi:ferric-chelate reductase